MLISNYVRYTVVPLKSLDVPPKMTRGYQGNHMYKIENITSDIKLIHPEHIANRFFINDDTVKISGIILEKPYKLQITAISKVDGKKKKRKKVIEYDDTLRNSVADALAKRTIWIQELRTELKSSAITDMGIAILQQTSVCTSLL